MSTYHAFDVFMIANGGWLAPSVIVFIINDHIFARIRWPLPYAMQLAKIVMTGLVVFAVVAVFLAMLVDSRFIEYHHIVIFASMYSAFLYVFLCDLLLIGVARFLTKKRGEKRVKELDYLYLSFGALGIIAATNKLKTDNAGLSYTDILGPLVIATALVIRLVKTRAEIGGWNKASFQSSAPTSPLVAE